jgi:aminomethyltransferase
LLPAGLAARDTLRTEMGYPLHGQDLSVDITPVQARLGWAVGWGKEAFWGAAALRAERSSGPARSLRGLVAVGRGIPRPGMAVYADSGDAPVGTVTSGTFSPTLRKGIALAFMETGIGGNGAQMYVDVRGRRDAFDLHKPPFVVPEVPTAEAPR